MNGNRKQSASPYRWVVLVLFMLPAIATQLQWITFAPIATDAAALYTGGNTESIDLFAVIFMLAYIPMSFPASWCIDTLGLKWGTGIGVIILGLSGFLRMFAPLFPDEVPHTSILREFIGGSTFEY